MLSAVLQNLDSQHYLSCSLGYVLVQTCCKNSRLARIRDTDSRTLTESSDSVHLRIVFARGNLFASEIPGSQQNPCSDLHFRRLGTEPKDWNGTVKTRVGVCVRMVCVRVCACVVYENVVCTCTVRACVRM